MMIHDKYINIMTVWQVCSGKVKGYTFPFLQNSFLLHIINYFSGDSNAGCSARLSIY